MVMLAVTLGLPVMAGAFALPRTRPHLARVAAALSAVATLALGLIGPVAAAAGVLAALVLVGLALLARPPPTPSLALLARGRRRAHRQRGHGPLPQRRAPGERSPPVRVDGAGRARRRPPVALVAGLIPLGLGALTPAVQRADLAPWSTPDAWKQAELGAGNVLRFADGGAPRQAPDAFGGYTGPVVVIALKQQERGAFRADGAPDDGWTVPGTLATVREALARAEARRPRVDRRRLRLRPRAARRRPRRGRAHPPLLSPPATPPGPPLRGTPLRCRSSCCMGWKSRRAQRFIPATKTSLTMERSRCFASRSWRRVKERPAARLGGGA